MRMRGYQILRLHLIHHWDRLRLRVRQWLHPGLQIHPKASSNFAVARLVLGDEAVLQIGSGVVADRIPGSLHFILGPGARVTIEEGTWLRSAVGPIYIVAFEDAEIRIGPDCFINGPHISAKSRVQIGRHTTIGVGSRIFDADQHDFDQERPEEKAPVEIGEHVWVTSDVTILKGVTIGDHTVIGARSVVTRDIPAHSLALGSPAQVRGRVGDRSSSS